MKRMIAKIRAKKGEITFEYVMLLALVGLGLIGALTMFKDKLVTVVDNQGESIQYATAESYCMGLGKTFAGSFDSNDKPVCN